MSVGNQFGDRDLAIRRLVSSAIERSGKDRSQVAFEMGALLHQHVTFRMLNDFSAESKKPARFPAAWIEAFCFVVSDDSLQRAILSPRLRKLLAFAERELAARRDEQEREQLRGELLREE